jgi:hypothetical protein
MISYLAARWHRLIGYESALYTLQKEWKMDVRNYDKAKLAIRAILQLARE